MRNETLRIGGDARDGQWTSGFAAAIRDGELQTARWLERDCY